VASSSGFFVPTQQGSDHGAPAMRSDAGRDDGAWPTLGEAAATRNRSSSHGHGHGHNGQQPARQAVAENSNSVSPRKQYQQSSLSRVINNQSKGGNLSVDVNANAMGMAPRDGVADLGTFSPVWSPPTQGQGYSNARGIARSLDENALWSPSRGRHVHGHGHNSFSPKHSSPTMGSSSGGGGMFGSSRRSSHSGGNNGKAAASGSHGQRKSSFPGSPRAHMGHSTSPHQHHQLPHHSGQWSGPGSPVTIPIPATDGRDAAAHSMHSHSTSPCSPGTGVFLPVPSAVRSRNNSLSNSQNQSKHTASMMYHHNRHHQSGSGSGGGGGNNNNNNNNASNSSPEMGDGLSLPEELF